MPDSKSKLRLSDLIEDTWNSSADELKVEWPHPDYAEAAGKCTGAEDKEKLQQVCDDMEALLSGGFRPGSPARLSGESWHSLRRFKEKCWREILCDPSTDKEIWIGIRRIGRAWCGKSMDKTTQRTGAILHAVAIARLQSLGALKALEPAHVAERTALVSKKYLPKFIRTILTSAI
jgi:hypothetical protein